MNVDWIRVMQFQENGEGKTLSEDATREVEN